MIARAPGRVNLIGEHTDYNDGFALPMALPFDTVVAMSSSGDPAVGEVVVSAAGFGDVTIDPTLDPRAVPPSARWALHLAGVVALLTERGVPAGGWRAAIDTDIPTGASLSSSAALEVALVTALLERAGDVWTAVEIADLGRRVENEVVGLQSGIMDQLISAAAVAGHASLIDCASRSTTAVALPDGLSVLVMDTGTRRVLADAAYDERRRACQAAAARLGVPALRAAGRADVARLVDDEVLHRRARHVVTENERVLAFVEALRSGDATTAGALMAASHASLRDDFEVSGDALDAIVAVAADAPGCLGARMTGGGFAGCAVALVETGAAERVAAAVRSGYRAPPSAPAPVGLWRCEPSAGAGLVR